MSIRLEKVLYERIFNTALFGRQRVITVPRLWDYDNLEKITKIAEQKPIFQKETGWRRIFEPTLAYFTFKWSFDIQIHRGNHSILH